VGAAYRDDDPVPIELALDHQYDGIVAVWLDGRDGLDAEALHAKLVDSGALDDLQQDSPIEITSSWTPRPEFRNSRDSAPMSLGSPGGQENRLCQVCFVAGDIRETLARFRGYTEAIAAQGIADTALAAPFLRTKVGTDTYVDRIW
jgi:hypothetical protein